ncbi:Zn(II)2Cys6 transcription factor [Aspergillus foveolatus]|uniref:Zn(II)2Cys6 transcription factor n=1 Tax=Aspergillus foveolatus TaxID=210207 RepID=UPI003CCD23AF
MVETRAEGLRQPQSPHFPRVSRACQRCRRQKLKCDEARPCTMCVRAGASCQSRDIMNTPIRRKKRAIRPQAAATSSNQHAAAAANHPYEGQNYGASSSAVGFAVNIFGQRATLYSSDISGIPGRASPQPNPRPEWTLEKMSMPPPAVMDAALKAYFDHMHWFIFIFHEIEFMQSVTPLLRQSSWSEASRGRVIAALTAAAVGLQCVAHDSRWPGHSLLASFSLRATSLRDSLIAEVRLHVLKLLDECSLESVQVSLLLGTYYVFHGSPGLAWNMLGLSVRTAYALSMHCPGGITHPDPVLSQVYRRTWNFIIVADTYSAMIYGRPASLDAAFCHLHEMTELEDTRLPPTVSYLLQDPNVNGLMFHNQKYRLYEIMRTTLNKVRLINLQTPVSSESFASLVEAIVNAQTSLDAWKSGVSPVLKQQYWKEHPALALTANGKNPSSSENRTIRHLFLQSQMLQLTYDSAVLFINRPLLEHQAKPEFRTAVSEHLSAVRLSMDLSLKAALRVSRVSPNHHESEFSLSFVLMNFFIAGVILCLAPTLWPFSTASNDAKAGVLRIIHASRNLQTKSKIAKHTLQLLTRLVKLSLQQELENALNSNESGSDINPREQEQGPSQHASPSHSPRLPPTEPCSSSTFKGHFNPLPVNSTQSQPAVDVPFPIAGVPAGDLYIEPMYEGGNLNPGLGIPDSSCYHQIDSYMDETLGAFGEMLFNLVPNDPYSAWNWGSTFR